MPLEPGTNFQLGLRLGTFRSPQNIISDPLLFCPDVTIGGIKRIWLGSRNKFGKWLLNETAPYQYGEIIGNTQNNSWWNLPIRQSDSGFTVTQELVPGRSYIVNLNLNFNKMDVVKRDTFERLSTARDSMFIVQDFNDNYWLLGESKGMSVEWSGKSDFIRISNDFSLTFNSRERFPVKVINPEYINEFVDIQIKTLCDYTFPEFCLLTFTQLKQIPFN